MPIAVYVPSRITEFVDVPVPDASDDAKALTYDHATGNMEWVAFEASGAVTAHVEESDPHTGYLLASGTRAGAVSGLQAFTAGIVTGIVRPASDSTTAVQVQNAAGSSGVLTVDTTNNKLLSTGLLVVDNKLDGNQVGTLVIDYLSSNNPLIFSIGGTMHMASAMSLYDNNSYFTCLASKSNDIQFIHNRTGDYGHRFESKNSAGSNTVRLRIGGGDTAPVYFDAARVFFGGSTTATSVVDITASTTSRSSLRIRAGTAPTSPNDGDIWFDGTNFKCRIGGVTKTFTVT